MRVGLIIFPTDKGIQPVELGREAEARGFDSLWFPEHSHIPVSRRTPWGGREGAPPLPEEYWRTHDQFVALAAEYADVLAGPPPGPPPDWGPEFELRIDTGNHPMPRSRPMTRLSQGELDECRQQIALLLDHASRVSVDGGVGPVERQDDLVWTAWSETVWVVFVAVGFAHHQARIIRIRREI